MKVIIIGAGISGLTLAAGLAQLASQHEVEQNASLPVLRPAGESRCWNPGVP